MEYSKIQTSINEEIESEELLQTIKKNESYKLKQQIEYLLEILETSSNFGIYVRNNMDNAEIKYNLIMQTLEILKIENLLIGVLSEKEGIRLGLLKTIDKLTQLPKDDEVFLTYGSTREYMINECRKSNFRSDLQNIATKYSEDEEQNFIDEVEEKVYFIDEIRETSKKFDGNKTNKEEREEDSEVNLSKILKQKYEIILENFNNGKMNVEKILARRRHHLFVRVYDRELIIKLGQSRERSEILNYSPIKQN